MLMTPGPTAVPPAVREAMSRPMPNPDVEPEFMEFYRGLTAKLQAVYGTDDDVVVLGGEGMLGLEASIASTVSDGDTVAVVANGIYGDGFAGLVEMHGGEPVTASAPYDEPLDVEAVKALVEEHDVAAATMVHCETPTGVLNDLDEVLGVLNDAGVLTIVDAVSSLGGTPVPVDDIDIALGASQKCFSSPPGLATLSVSDEAWAVVEETDAGSFYTDLEPWRDAEKDDEMLPYTPLTANLYALDASLDRLFDEGVEHVFARHEEVAAYTRERGAELGLSIYPADESLASPTVTAFHLPGEAAAVQQAVKADHDIVLGTGIGDLADDVLRVGHMGYGASMDRVEQTMDAIEAVLAAR